MNYKSDTTYKSYSMIKLFAKSKQLYKFRYIDKIEQEPTQSMEFGTRIHEYILENREFHNKYFTDESFWEGSRDKTYKQKLQEYIQENNLQDKKLIKAEDMQIIKSISEMLFGSDEYKHISELLLDFEENEREIMHRIDKRYFKGRPDKFNTNKKIIIDLKTCSDLSEFEKDANKYGYFIQQSLYKKLLEERYGGKFEFIFIGVSTKEPYYAELFTFGNVDDEIAWDYICDKYDKIIEFENELIERKTSVKKDINIINISQWSLK